MCGSQHTYSLEMHSAKNSKWIFFLLFLKAEPGEERISRNSETQSSMRLKQWREKKTLTALSKSNVKKKRVESFVSLLLKSLSRADEAK